MIGEFQKIQIMIGLVRKPSHVTRHFWWWWWWWWVVVVGGGGGGIRRKNGLYHTGKIFLVKRARGVYIFYKVRLILSFEYYLKNIILITVITVLYLISLFLITVEIPNFYLFYFYFQFFILFYFS